MRVQGTHTLVARLTASAAAHMCLCKAHTHPWLKAESLCKTQAQHMSLWKAQSKRKVAEGTTNGHVPVQGKSPHTCACARRTQTHTLGSRLTNSARHKHPHMCLCKAHTHTHPRLTAESLCKTQARRLQICLRLHDSSSVHDCRHVQLQRLQTCFSWVHDCECECLISCVFERHETQRTYEPCAASPQLLLLLLLLLLWLLLLRLPFLLLLLLLLVLVLRLRHRWHTQRYFAFRKC